MDWFGATALFGGGLLAGTINAMAGGGSLLTLPLLVFLGLPATEANASNRVAVLANSVTSAAGYHQSGHLPWRTVRLLLVPSLVGSLVGAWVATLISDDAFRPVIAVVLLAMAALLVFRPSALDPRGGGEPLPPLAEVLLFLGIGFYGGFIQAGIGFFILAATVRGAGLDLIRANGVKVALTLALTLVALGVFIAAGQVRWAPALVLAAGNGIGGYFGARLAVARGAGWVRWVVVVMVVASALELLGIYRAIGRLLGL
ncbi:sulfite exporter TauE/SafE family protein [Vulgatibacter sp.]|uniref:sulfite exporter TauE/SafE family protein n=1 Tax=Vulgatibacter sp. TaxID=1971226 RepID=UPI0035659096